MNKTPRLRADKKDFAAIAIAAGLAVFLLAVMGGWRYDDPYITYRFARNIRDGLGFVYNPGEHTLSTTSPLFAVVLAALQNPWLDAPGVAVVIGAVSLPLGGLAFWALGRVWQAEIAGLTGLVLYPLFPLAFVTLGSETPLYLALCVWAFALAARRRYALAGACAGLAFLARGDGALVALVIGGWLLVAMRQEPSPARRALRFALGWLAPVVPWVVFAALYFGSPLPVTMQVKMAQGRMMISTGFAAGFATVRGWYLGGGHFVAEAVLAGLGVVAAPFLRKRAGGFALLAGWSALYAASFAALGVSSYFWYYAPLAVGFVAAAGMGFEALFGLLRRVNARAGALVCALAIGWLGYAHTQSAIGIARFGADKRIGIYRAAGEWLRDNTPPNASVGALEVGVIGYYAQRPMIDFAGLIQPQMARQFTRETTYDTAALSAFRAFHPAYVAQLDGALPGLEAELGRQGCVTLTRFAGKDFGYQQDISILKCY